LDWHLPRRIRIRVATLQHTRCGLVHLLVTCHVTAFPIYVTFRCRTAYGLFVVTLPVPDTATLPHYLHLPRCLPYICCYHHTDLLLLFAHCCTYVPLPVGIHLLPFTLPLRYVTLRFRTFGPRYICTHLRCYAFPAVTHTFADRFTLFICVTLPLQRYFDRITHDDNFTARCCSFVRWPHTHCPAPHTFAFYITLTLIAVYLRYGPEKLQLRCRLHTLPRLYRIYVRVLHRKRFGLRSHSFGLVLG